MVRTFQVSGLKVVDCDNCHSIQSVFLPSSGVAQAPRPLNLWVLCCVLANINFGFFPLTPRHYPC
uniref:Uncharacterized protein n=1 Tax=Anguilla anguilla TaxID=7936 RepID=A0A0E9QTB9_ANGAN